MKRILYFCLFVFVFSCSSENNNYQTQDNYPIHDNYPDPLKSIKDFYLSKPEVNKKEPISIILEKQFLDQRVSPPVFKHTYRVLYKDTTGKLQSVQTADYFVNESLYNSQVEYKGFCVATVENEALINKVIPPAYNYVGNSQYGQWKKNEDGNEYWEFIGQYAFLQSLQRNMYDDYQEVHVYHYYRDDYDDYRKNYSNHQTVTHYYQPKRIAVARTKTIETAKANAQSNLKSRLEKIRSYKQTTSSNSSSSSRYSSGSSSRYSSGSSSRYSSGSSSGSNSSSNSSSSSSSRYSSGSNSSSSYKPKSSTQNSSSGWNNNKPSGRGLSKSSGSSSRSGVRSSGSGRSKGRGKK